MSLKKFYPKSSNFWIISSVSIIAVFYTFFSEIVPHDWFMTSRSYKKNSAFSYKKTFRRLLIADNTNFQCVEEKYFDQPDLLFEKTDHLFKNRRHKTKVALVEVNGRRYIAKKYNIPSFKVWLWQVPIRSSKAFRSWYYGNALYDLNIATPKVQLLIEKKIGILWTECYCLSDFIDGVLAVDYFNENSPFKEEWEKTIHELKNLIDQLNSHYIIHGDLSLNNIVIQNGTPFLIDLDRVHQYSFNHTYYKVRYKTQHLARLTKKFGEVSREAQLIFLNIFNLPDSPHAPLNKGQSISNEN
ncbi:MAG: hypothetical protein S4CHLAM7_08050 [Chlamydiae bacterium]|nr:hypothetical protein [Chlamydiota bacterium]